MSGEVGNDQLDGGNGNDTLSGGDDSDVLYGDGDDDVLNGEEGNDNLNGGDGIDTLNGGNGNDMLFGGANTDWSFGEVGDDFLVLDQGDDYLGGGAGHDRFSFRPHPSYAAGFGNDVIYDFTRGEDRIEISGVSTYSLHWVAAENDGLVDDLRLDFPTAEASSLTLINADPIVENVDLFFV